MKNVTKLINKTFIIFVKKNCTMKMIKLLFFYAACLLGIIFLSCAKSGRPDYKVSVGDTLNIELNYTAGTGYSWYLINKNELTLMDSVSVDYVYDAPEGFMGGAGRSIWRFVAKSKGVETIVFVYKRPWESEEIERKEITVKVK